MLPTVVEAVVGDVVVEWSSDVRDFSDAAQAPKIAGTRLPQPRRPFSHQNENACTTRRHINGETTGHEKKIRSKYKPF